MKIVDRKTFLLMPPGTVYSNYPEKVLFEVYGIFIKHETLENGNDWLYTQLDRFHSWDNFDDHLEKWGKMERGVSVPNDHIEHGTDRDALFQDEQYFAIHEKEEVRQFISLLQTAFENAYSTI